MCCNLTICDKITRFVAFFLVDDFCRLPFQNLKSNKINFGFAKAVLDKSAKTGPFRIFYAKSHTLL